MAPRGGYRGRGQGKLPPKKRNQSTRGGHSAQSSARSGFANNGSSTSVSTSGKSSKSNKSSKSKSSDKSIASVTSPASGNSSELQNLIARIKSEDSELSSVQTSNFSPSNTVFQILSELQLSFNPSLGTLEGSNLINGIYPKGSVDKKALLTTRSLLEKLINELKLSIKVDDEVIQKLETDLKANEQSSGAIEAKTGPGRRGRKKMNSPIKRKYSELEESKSDIDSKLDEVKSSPNKIRVKLEKSEEEEDENVVDKKKSTLEETDKDKGNANDKEEEEKETDANESIPKIKVKMKLKKKDEEDEEQDGITTDKMDMDDKDTEKNQQSNDDENDDNDDDDDEDGESGDDNDEDDEFKPLRRRRRKIITVANGKRREISVKDEDSESGSEDSDDNDKDGDYSKDIETDFVDKDNKDAMDVDDDGDKDNKLGGQDDENDDSNGDTKNSNLDPNVVPSVYYNKPEPHFDIEGMLKPAAESLHLYEGPPVPEPISCPEDVKSPEEEERLKKKFAVAEFPHHDLKDLLPGVIPDKDFSNSKPSNQIAFNSFQTYIEPFFRSFTDEDIKLLRTKLNLSSNLPKDYDYRVSPYLIPKLGPYYADVWHEEDIKAGIIPAEEKPFDSLKELEYYANLKVQPRGSSDDLSNEVLETEMVSIGPLASRLLSALLKDETNENGEYDEDDETEGGNKDKDENNNVGTPMDEDSATANTNKEDGASNANSNAASFINQLASSSALADQQGWKSSIIKADYETLDERLKRELKHIGVYMNVEQTLNEKQSKLLSNDGSNNSSNNNKFEEDWVIGREDDEISSELRSLQKQLKEVTSNNQRRKKLLIPIVEEQIAWQEYMSILDDLDKQVEQSYRRRISVTPKKSKKKSSSSSSNANGVSNGSSGKDDLSAHQVAANSGFRALLDKRLKWIEKIGPLFKSEIEMRRMPKESIFNNLDKVLDNGNSNNNEDGDGDGDGDGGEDDDDVVGVGMSNDLNHHDGVDEVEGLNGADGMGDSI